MKKGDPKLKRLCVEYKGGELILQPGHKVFELDLKTGLVSEYKLKIKLLTILSKRKTYYVEDHPDKLHIPAFDINKALISFKKLARPLNINVKIKQAC